MLVAGEILKTKQKKINPTLLPKSYLLFIILTSLLMFYHFFCFLIPSDVDFYEAIEVTG